MNDNIYIINYINLITIINILLSSYYSEIYSENIYFMKQEMKYISKYIPTHY